MRHWLLAVSSDVLSLTVSLLGLVVVASTVVAAFQWRRRLGRPQSTSPGRLDDQAVEPLLDGRSCFQTTLRMVGVILEAASTTHSLPPTEDVAACRAMVRLLLESPGVGFSEVIDDRRLLGIEAGTLADVVWIVSPEQVIEFEYADTVSFSSVVIANLSRGVKYRYLANDDAATRARAKQLHAFLSERGLAHGFEVRFIEDDYWIQLAQRTAELVLFEVADSPELFYRFPPFGAISSRWVRAPEEDTDLRLADLKATWDVVSLKPADQR